MDELHSAWYRSITPDGKLWCESSDPKEVIKRSKGKECTFQIFRIRLVSDGWEPWEKKWPIS